MKTLRWWLGRACYAVIVRLPVGRGFYNRPAFNWVARIGMTWFYDRCGEEMARREQEEDEAAQLEEDVMHEEHDFS